MLWRASSSGRRVTRTNGAGCGGGCDEAAKQKLRKSQAVSPQMERLRNGLPLLPAPSKLPHGPDH